MGFHQTLEIMGVDLLVLIMFVLTPTLSAAPVVLPNFPIAKPNCVDRCGTLSIPFPFGTKRDCYRNESFLVTCNETFLPPKLFIRNTSTEITSISLDGHLRVMQPIAEYLYARPNDNEVIDLPWSFTINNTANIVTVLGCNSHVFINSSDVFYGIDSVQSCNTKCVKKDDLSGGSCEEISGCCQRPVSDDVSRVRFTHTMTSDSSIDSVISFNNRTYAFLAEKTAFSFSRYNLTDLRTLGDLPMVVDWAIGSGTCEEARMSSTNSVCASLNSECYKPNNGVGYRCQCKQGYEGNPYLVDGCRDVDECELNKCTNDSHSCSNTQGGFNCSCPKGYDGDGKKDGTGCRIINLPGGESNMYKIVAGVAVGISVVLFVACWLYTVFKKRKVERVKQKYFVQNGGVMLQEKLARIETSAVTVSIFSSTELQKATKNFHSSMIVGQGGFGTVYKGTLTDDRIIAVKKSKEVDPKQNEQFINEVIVLSQINHRNVVKLLGCCLETPTPLLVYEFISNGTLFEHIHSRPKITHNSLNWELRLKIAIETAGVLAYLHSETSVPIIHRDIKSSNILLDDTFTAKVSDFGASRLVPLDQTRLSTLVQGTFGYLDPEYMQTSQLTEKSDVYSFGVVLVELLTSMKALSYDRPEEERNLSNFFLSMLKKEQLFQILDGDIVCEENRDQLIKVAGIAKWCLNVRGEDRPSIKEVAMGLEGLRLGGKHSWFPTERNAEEMDSVLGERTNRTGTNDDYSITIEFENSLRNYIMSVCHEVTNGGKYSFIA